MRHENSYIFKNTVCKESDQLARTVLNGPGKLTIGPPPEFGGRPEILSPEELFVAAINNCIMTTFFYFARKLHVECSLYFSEAEGQVEKQADGLRFTHVKVRAKVALPQEDSAEKVREVGNLAEKYCLISRSVACPVDYQLEVEIREKKR